MPEEFDLDALRDWLQCQIENQEASRKLHFEAGRDDAVTQCRGAISAYELTLGKIERLIAR